MTELILFHHALGLTDGVHAFADDLRAGGHVVHVPDLFEGRSFSEIAIGALSGDERRTCCVNCRLSSRLVRVASGSGE